VGSRVVAYLWEWEGDRPRRLRVLRSRRGFAVSADDAWQGAGGQFMVYEGEGTSLRDAGLAPLTDHFYTFYMRDGAGEWRELLRERITTLAEDAPPRGKPLLGDDGGTPGAGTRSLLEALDDLTGLLLP
jgi:transposase InsO family protein